MSDTSPEPLAKVTPQNALGPITGAIIPAAEAFFESLQAMLKSQQVANPNQDDFLTRFVLGADGFADRCCRDLAPVIHEVSGQAEVRETTEGVLARLIRNRCFETLDNILIELVGVLSLTTIRVENILAQLSESRAKDDLKGAALNAHVPAGTSPKTVALFKVWEYIKACENLPQDLVDYSATKIFGVNADLGSHQGFIFNVRDAIQDTWRSCLDIIESFDAIKEKMWDEQRASDLAMLKEAAVNSLLKTTKRKSCVGWLIAGGLFGLMGWGVSVSGITERYAVISALALGGLGIILCMVGLFYLSKR